MVGSGSLMAIGVEPTLEIASQTCERLTMEYDLSTLRCAMSDVATSHRKKISEHNTVEDFGMWRMRYEILHRNSHFGNDHFGGGFNIVTCNVRCAISHHRIASELRITTHISH